MTTWLTIGATAISAALIATLALGDPKRRRAANLPGGGHGPAKRWSCGLGAMLPGLLIALTGDAAAWLIWFGGCAVAGWLVALRLSRAKVGGEQARKIPKGKFPT